VTPSPDNECDFSSLELTEATLTDWHQRLCKGDDRVTELLWETYFLRMVVVARRSLQGAPTVARDEEDVALSAFKSFCLGIRQGRIRLNQNQLNLWPLLVTITLNKAIDQIRHENREKRRPVSQRSAAIDPSVEELVSREPSAEMLSAATESFVSLMTALDRTRDAQLRQIAVASMEGGTLAEIAATMNCSTRTVQRKLKTIRRVWESESA
jgi:RNA polymerase sigma factor (sigma-70 family)